MAARRNRYVRPPSLVVLGTRQENGRDVHTGVDRRTLQAAEGRVYLGQGERERQRRARQLARQGER